MIRTLYYSILSVPVLILLAIIAPAVAYSQTYLLVDNNIGLKFKTKAGKWGVQEKGEWVIMPEYDRIDNAGYLLYARKSDKLDVYAKYYINPVPVIKNIRESDLPNVSFFIYSEVARVFYFDAKYCPLHADNLWGWQYYDKTIAPAYDSIRLNDRKEINVFRNGQSGILMRSGEVVVPLKDYSSIAYLHNFSINGNYVAPFYVCRLPDESYELYQTGSTGYTKMPEEFTLTYVAQQRAKEEKLKWLAGLKFYAKNGQIGIKDKAGNIILPAVATAITMGKYDLDPDDDVINISIEITSDITQKWTFKESVPIRFDKAWISEEEMYNTKIMAELNPYNSLTGIYNLYFDQEIHPAYDYKSGSVQFSNVCPLCEGSGKLKDGFDVIKQTFTYDRIVKDGSTTITRKNYLANERVGADGRVYTPEYTQTHDNYRTEKEEVVSVTHNQKYKTCTICEGKKNYKIAIIVWDNDRNDFVLQSLEF